MKCLSLSVMTMALTVCGFTADAEAGGGLFSLGSHGSSGGSYGSSGGSYGSSGGSYGSSGGSYGSSGGSSGGISRREQRLIYRAAKRSASSGSSGSSGGSYGSSGSSGGSYGSTGSSGGSYGSHGSSGGSSGGSKAALRKARRAASHGSSGGSSGGASSGGSYGSSSSGGSSGGTSSSYGSGSYGHVSSAAAYTRPTAYAVTTPAPYRRSVVATTPVRPTVAPVYTAQKPAAQAYAYVVVQLPEDAKLYLGGNVTQTSGSVRKFKIPVANATASYPYAVRAELTRNGQVYVASSTETLVAGKTVSVKVNDVASANVNVAAR